MRRAISNATIDCIELANSPEQDWISPCVCAVWWDPAPSIFSCKILFSAVTWGWADQYLFTQPESNFHMRSVIHAHLNHRISQAAWECNRKGKSWPLYEPGRNKHPLPPKNPPFRRNYCFLHEEGNEAQSWDDLIQYKPWWFCGHWDGDTTLWALDIQVWVPISLSRTLLFGRLMLLFSYFIFGPFAAHWVPLQSMLVVHQTGQFLSNCWEISLTLVVVWLKLSLFFS